MLFSSICAFLLCKDTSASKLVDRAVGQWRACGKLVRLLT